MKLKKVPTIVLAFLLLGSIDTKADAASLTILTSFSKEEEVTFKRKIHEKGKKKDISITKKTKNFDLTEEEKKQIMDRMNERYKGTGVTFIDDPSKPHDAVLDFTNSESPSEIKKKILGTTGLDRKGAWVYIKPIEQFIMTGKRQDLIKAITYTADHEAGHIAGAKHSKTGLMKAKATKKDLIDDTEELSDFSKKQIAENMNLKSVAPAGTGTKNDLMFFLGIPDDEPSEAPDLIDLDDSINLEIDFLENILDNPQNPFEQSFDLGYLNAEGEFVFMMGFEDILSGENSYSFYGGDSVLLSLRDSSNNLFNALTGHALLPIFSDPVGSQLFTNSDVSFDLNQDDIVDVTVQVHTLNEESCGTGCNGIMPAVPEPTSPLSLLAIGIGGAAFTLKRKLK